MLRVRAVLRFVLGLIVSVSTTTISAAQTPIAPVNIQPSPGAANPITVSVVGVEQDPKPITPRWNASETCLADIPCFLSSWIMANTSGDVERVLLLRSPAERGDLEKRLSKEPRILTLNSARFKTTRAWGFLGWVEYGSYRFILLCNEDEQGSRNPFTLPVQRVGNTWAQTDALSKQTYAFAIVDRVARAVMERHLPK
jgi:hypothetical protein